jgi:hypothetical protein
MGERLLGQEGEDVKEVDEVEETEIGSESQI